MEILILGGGASGMMAALSASEAPDRRVTLLERQARVGRKLLSTGNGRCNLSNLNLDLSHYHGQCPQFAQAAFAQFPVEKTLSYFQDLGLITVSEPSGRLYPYSNQANSVVDVLRLAMTQRGIRVLTGWEAIKIWKKGTGFLVKTNQTDLAADRLIVACGGAAGSKLGGTQSGYSLLKALGHHLSPLSPSLVQIKTDPTYPRSLKGIRAEAHIQLCRSSQILAQRLGEIQFTDFGLSGPAIFDISRAVSTQAGDLQVILDFFPSYSFAQVTTFLVHKQETFPSLPADTLFTGMLHNRLGQCILSFAGIPHQMPLEQLSQKDLQTLVHGAKAFPLAVTGTLGMDQAQVTAGGMLTREFDAETLESKLIPGLYACGEVLDIDGDCGGYNLQWAWSSGYLAGKTLSKEGFHDSHP